MTQLMTTKEVAQHLGINEKMVYALISDKGLPASKVTGKWLFPKHLVDQWVEAHTINLQPTAGPLQTSAGLLIIAGSNDPLLEQTIGLYNSLYPENLAVFGNIGSLGGIRSLKQDLCHIATSHLLQENGSDYNFDVAGQHVTPAPVVVNFCRRHQGLIVAKDNPRNIRGTADLLKAGLRVVNRKLGTGTRQLFDRELKTAQINGAQLEGYTNEVQRHMDVGLAVLSGHADAGPGIEPIARMLGLDFVPWRWERYDLLMHKERFFNQAMQSFIGLLHENRFHQLAQNFQGYDTGSSGKIIFPQPPGKKDSSLVEE